MHSSPAWALLVNLRVVWYLLHEFEGKMMNTPRNTNLFDNIISAFAQGLTFGFGYNDSVRDYKAGVRISRDR